MPSSCLFTPAGGCQANRRAFRTARLAGVLLPLFVAGCGDSAAKPVVGRTDASRQNLQRIGIAYSQATTKLSRPPKSVEELLPFLRDDQTAGNPRDLLRSPDDGEEYVIVWDLDFGKLAAARGDPYVVFVYEKKGKGGRRHVMKPPNHVVEMSDSEFRKAPFPPGHQPAF